MQLSFQLVLCVVGAQCVFSGEPGVSVASLLHVFTESVPSQGFSFGSRWSGILQLYILCLGTSSIPINSSTFGGFFQMFFFWFCFNLVLPDGLVIVCWTESQDKLAKGIIFWLLLCG